MATCVKCKGLLNLVIDGRSIMAQSDGDITILISNFNRTATYNAEFTSEERNPTITIVVVVPADEYVRFFQELSNVPIVVELCDGRTFSAEGASNVSQDPYDAKNNTQPLEL